MNSSTDRYTIPCRSRRLNRGAICVTVFLAVFWCAVGAALIWWPR